MTHFIKFDGISGTSANSAYVGYCRVFAFQDDGGGSLSFKMSFAKGSSELFAASVNGSHIASAVMVQDEDGSILLKSRYADLMVDIAEIAKNGNAFKLQYGASSTDYPQWSAE